MKVTASTLKSEWIKSVYSYVLNIMNKTNSVESSDLWLKKEKIRTAC